MTRTISIRSTPLLKFVLAPIWLVGAAYAIWILWARPESVLDDYQPGAMTALQLILLALLAASLVVLFVFVVPLKRVRLAPDGLLVSNFLKDAVIPFSAIASVRQYSLPTFRLVTLRLRDETAFGRRVVFLPAVPVRTAFWRKDYGDEDELVRELRALAGSATS